MACVICDVDDCKYCEDGVCTAPKIDIDKNGQCAEYNS